MPCSIVHSRYTRTGTPSFAASAAALCQIASLAVKTPSHPVRPSPTPFVLFLSANRGFLQLPAASSLLLWQSTPTATKKVPAQHALARPCTLTARRRECGARNQRSHLRANLHETAKRSLLRRNHSSGSAPTRRETRPSCFPWPMTPFLLPPSPASVRKRRRTHHHIEPAHVHQAPTPTQMGAYTRLTSLKTTTLALWRLWDGHPRARSSFGEQLPLSIIVQITLTCMHGFGHHDAAEDVAWWTDAHPVISRTRPGRQTM